MRWLNRLWQWWQAQLSEQQAQPPYPLTYDEWEFIQQREAAREVAIAWENYVAQQVRQASSPLADPAERTNGAQVSGK
ncbi:MAG: hypothetical protein ACRYFK_14440 [Janthinobacterium lividum]